MVKDPPADAGDRGDLGLIPELGRSPGGGYSNPLQYSCLENLIEDLNGLSSIGLQTDRQD